MKKFCLVIFVIFFLLTGAICEMYHIILAHVGDGQDQSIYFNNYLKQYKCVYLTLEL